MSRNVTYARLQTIIHIPNVGQLSETLSVSASAPKTISKMYLEDGLLFVTCKGTEVAIPLANLTHMVFEGQTAAKPVTPITGSANAGGAAGFAAKLSNAKNLAEAQEGVNLAESLGQSGAKA
jgi:hypothetical protein